MKDNDITGSLRRRQDSRSAFPVKSVSEPPSNGRPPIHMRTVYQPQMCTMGTTNVINIHQQVHKFNSELRRTKLMSTLKITF